MIISDFWKNKITKKTGIEDDYCVECLLDDFISDKLEEWLDEIVDKTTLKTRAGAYKEEELRWK